MRTLVDLPDDDIAWLDARAAAEGKSRAALVRAAIAAFRGKIESRDRVGTLERGFGAWARLGEDFDPHAYERRRRAEWTRPWNEDWEEVRAESPECFDAQDERDRAIYLQHKAQAEARKRDAA